MNFDDLSELYIWKNKLVLTRGQMITDIYGEDKYSMLYLGTCIYRDKKILIGPCENFVQGMKLYPEYFL